MSKNLGFVNFLVLVNFIKQFIANNITANTVRSNGKLWRISMFFKKPLKKSSTKASSGRHREKIIKAMVKKTPAMLTNNMPIIKIDMQMRRFCCSASKILCERFTKNFLFNIFEMLTI